MQTNALINAKYFVCSVVFRSIFRIFNIDVIGCSLLHLSLSISPSFFVSKDPQGVYISLEVCECKQLCQFTVVIVTLEATLGCNSMGFLNARKTELNIPKVFSTTLRILELR